MEVKISIGADHVGYEIKQILKKWLELKSITIKDFGTHSLESTDYPVFGHQVAVSVQDNESDFGILICGSGQGMSITANKYKEIRAALCWDKTIAILARQHNNANILVLPGRFLNIIEAMAITEAFLTTKFEGGRHKRRIEMIEANLPNTTQLQTNGASIRNLVMKLYKQQKLNSAVIKNAFGIKSKSLGGNRFKLG
ncbi:MAG: ribose 5-phosphate isomerase B [Prolixibacteraceae bacterium]|nr:ribose 5-phosphate isomerase B [Prolixibacteraceae bacterium]